MKIYLAGPIFGLTYAECTGWRDAVSEVLLPLEGVSPLRLDHQGRGTYGNELGTMPFPERFDRDYKDVAYSDGILVNMLGAKRKSIGTTCEMAWSYMIQLPTALVVEPEGNVNYDPFLWECVRANPNGVIVPTLKEGVNHLRTFFGYPAYIFGDNELV